MRTRLLLLAVLASGVAVCVYALRHSFSSAPSTMPNGGAPRLECPRAVDLGERELGEIAVTNFTIANAGGTDLQIDQIRSSCACSAFEQEHDGEFVRIESLRLEPKQKTQIRVRMSVQGKPGGPARSVIYFRTNDNTRPEAAIEVYVTRIRAGATAQPRSVVIGSMPVGSAVRRVVEIRDSATKPRGIDHLVSSDPDHVVARILPAKGVGRVSEKHPAGRLIGRIEIVVASQDPGPVDCHVEVHLTDRSSPPTLVAVNGRVVGLVEISPSTVVLPRASDAGPIYVANCICRSTRASPVNLIVDDIPDGISVRVNRIAGKGDSMIIIEWDPLRDREMSRCSVRIVRLTARIRDEEMNLEIPVTCIRNGSQE